MKNNILLFILFFCWSNIIFAQKFNRSLELPLAFSKPVDNPAYYLSPIKPVVASTPWIVICDRSEPDLTQTFSKPDPNSQKMKNIEWLESYYVVDEEKDWVRLVKGRRKQGLEFYDGTVQDFGWIMKKNVLLWNSSLRDSRTGIHLKAFLLNKAKELKDILKLKNKDVANIYKGPETTTTIGEKQIYEFYFVLKKENNRYLLCKNETTGEAMTDEIVGWVEERRATDWNTRISFEPNFDQNAFKERSSNKALMCMGFADQQSANKYVETGTIDNESVIWDNDPIRLSADQLAKENPRRFKGAVVRFPMLTNNDKSFTSGVIGDIVTKNAQVQQGKISEISYSSMVNTNQKVETGRNNYNVLFLIEGTNGLATYNAAIIESMKKLKIEMNDVPNLKFGAAIYRDVPEAKSNKLLEIKRLTSNMDDVISFVQNAEFGRWHDNDDYTALNYCLQQSLLETGLDKSHTNIICVLGSYADFIQNKVRRTDAETENSQQLVKREKIESLLANVNAHLLFIQVKAEDSDASEKFARQARSFILEAAKLQYDEYKNVKTMIPNLVFGNPDIADIDEGNDIRIQNGPNIGRLIKPDVGKTLSKDKVQQVIVETLVEIKKYNEETMHKMSRMIEDGESIGEVSAGAFAPAMAKLLYTYLKDKKTNAYSEEDVKKLVDDKYKLYQQVYLPKKAKGSRYDAMSYVLFMPKSDLEDYVRQLKGLKRALSETNDVRRETLYNFLLSLLERYTGNKSNSKDANKLSTQDLREIMQGLKKEGGKGGLMNLTIPGQEDFNIGDVKDKRKLTDEQVLNFVRKISDKANQIDDILEKGEDYEFSYKSSKNRYYWIPLEITF